MADKKLEELKEKKLKEMRKKLAGERSQREEREKQAKMLKKAILRRYLTSDARERLGRVRLAHEELAKRAEMAILQAIRRRGREKKINEEELKSILKRLS